MEEEKEEKAAPAPARRRGRPPVANPKQKRRRVAAAEEEEDGPTYPDPDDVDDNPVLLPRYLPSRLPSPSLFAHVLHHLSTFRLSQAPLQAALQTSSSTLSWVLKRKYQFKALGVVKGMREWMSDRDRQLVRLCCLGLREKWPRGAGGEEKGRGGEGKEREDGSLTGPWLEPVHVRAVLERVAPTVACEELALYVRQELSVERKQLVEDALAPWLLQVEAEWKRKRLAAELAAAKAATAELEALVPALPNNEGVKEEGGAASKARTGRGRRPARRASAHVNYVEVGDSSDDDVLVAGVQRAEEKRDDSWQQAEAEQPEEEESEEDRDSSLSDSSPSSQSSPKQAVKRRGYRRYSHEDAALTRDLQPSVVAAHPSPFTDKAWSIADLPLQPFNPAVYAHPDYSTLTFYANSTPLTLLPFIAASAESSTFLHAGGPITALAYAPAGSPTHSPASEPHFLATAHSHSIHLSPYRWRGRGVVALWRVDGDSPRLVMAITHDRGDVLAMEWFRAGVWEPEEEIEPGMGRERRLGVLALACSGGSVEVVMVPHPREEWKEAQAVELDALPHVSLPLPPLSRDLPLPAPVPTALTFSPHPSPPYLAVGASNGSLLVYSLRSMIPANAGPPPPPSHHLLPRLGHQPLRSLRWSPVNPYHVLMGTGDGYALIVDLRRPHLPLYHHSLTTDGPITALHWPACRPDLFLAAAGPAIRSCSLLSVADRAPLMLRGLQHVPVSPTAVCWGMAVVEDGGGVGGGEGGGEDGGGVVVTVAVWSDGTVAAVREEARGMGKAGAVGRGGGSSVGLSVTTRKWRPGRGGEGVKGEGEEEQGGGGEGEGEGELEVLNGCPAAWGGGKKGGLREKRMRMRPHRWGAKRVERGVVDDGVAVMAVAVNPNVVYPRCIASGGLMGVVRLQRLGTL